MRFSDSLKEMVLQGASTAELKLGAIRNGMSTLRMPAASARSSTGVTTPEEVMRVTMARLRREIERMTQPAEVKVNLHQLLKTMVEKGASDMHITTGSPPQLRIDGAIVPLKLPPLGPVETKQLCYSVLTEEQKHQFEKDNELDLSFGVKGLSRFRANIFMQRGAVAGAFRTIPFKILTFDELGLPPDRRRASRTKPQRPGAGDRPDGLGQVDDARRDHRQDQHRAARSTSSPSKTRSSTCTRTSSRIVNQREVGTDTEGFKNALKYVLRQDPDVVLVGEMRDLETIEAALTISETGHLVFATLHTNSARLDHQPHHRRLPAPPAAAGAARSCRSCSRA